MRCPAAPAGSPFRRRLAGDSVNVGRRTLPAAGLRPVSPADMCRCTSRASCQSAVGPAAPCAGARRTSGPTPGSTAPRPPPTLPIEPNRREQLHPDRPHPGPQPADDDRMNQRSTPTTHPPRQPARRVAHPGRRWGQIRGELPAPPPHQVGPKQSAAVGPNQSATPPPRPPRMGPDQRRTVGPSQSATATEGNEFCVLGSLDA